MEEPQDPTLQPTSPLASNERNLKRLQRDVGSFVQRRPVKIALMSCAGLGVMAGGSALVNTLREARARRERAWLRRAWAARARASSAGLAPSAGLLTAGALIGAGLTMLFTRRGELEPIARETAERAAEAAKSVIPEYH